MTRHPVKPGLHIKRTAGLPLYLCPVAAAFPSSAEECLEKLLDINAFLIQKSAVTFLVELI